MTTSEREQRGKELLLVIAEKLANETAFQLAESIQFEVVLRDMGLGELLEAGQECCSYLRDALVEYRDLGEGERPFVTGIDRALKRWDAALAKLTGACGKESKHE